jgi:aminopeptidase N
LQSRGKTISIAAAHQSQLLPMISSRICRLSLGLLLTLATRGTAEEDLICHQAQAAFAPRDSSDHRKYAPHRQIDILHVAIDVTPDFMQRTVVGKVTLRFKPISQPFQELKLDGVDLTVSAVTATAKIMGWQSTDKNVIVTFDQPIAPDTETSVTISYSATPKRGLYFRTPEMGYKAQDMHVWTQGETIEARHWFPCYDAPNEKFTSEVTCRVPEGMVVLSNGKLVSEEKDAGSGLMAVRWLQDKPHANYLIALTAGYFKKVEDKYKDIPLAFYTPASQIEQAMNSFKDTKDIMGFFEREIGVPYPWAKYYQVVVDDFTAGGMENTTLTILTENTLHTTATENLRDSQGLVAHEMAHQWFGDLVTCKDWSHIWLNEGFATFYEQLYDGYKHGRDEMLYRFYESARGIIEQPNQTNAIVRRDYNSPDDLFNYLAYPKGAWVLRMLRSQLGEDLFRRCILTYVERHKFDNVVTEDLNAVVEELSGRSFDQFFDQWVYHAAQPDLAVDYAWDEKAKLARLSVQQNQKLSDDVLLFDFPLTVRFQTKAGNVDRAIAMKEKAEDFYFPLAEAPEIVRVDPEMSVLAKVSFHPPTPMLYAQLADKNDALGRVLAAEQLGGKKERGAVAKLKETLNADPFYAVRLAASQALRSIQTDEAVAALLASTKQTDARVRRQVMVDIGTYYRESSYAAAQKTLQEEKNPDIQAAALRALAPYSKSEVRATLLQYLDSDSYRSMLADAAIAAMRVQDDAGYVEPLQAALQKKEAIFTSGVLSRGLETLGWLARHEDKKDRVREFLTGYVNHAKKRVQLSAIIALGQLDDPKAVAVLDTFTGGTKESPERAAAERAVASLRDSKKPPVELGNLRNEVLKLQNENRQLRKDFDDLKKKLDVLAAQPERGKPSKATSKAPKS